MLRPLLLPVPLKSALGDFTASALGLGYLASGIVFAVVFCVPAVAWGAFGANSVFCFWFAYVLTRPLGASFADYLSKSHALSGLDFGDGPTAVVMTIPIVVLVAYLTVTRIDIQPHHHGAHRRGIHPEEPTARGA